MTYSSTTGLRTAVAVKLYTYPIHLPNNLFIHYGTADRGSTYIIHRVRVRVRVRVRFKEGVLVAGYSEVAPIINPYM